MADTTYYAPSTQGFYLTSIHGDTIPPDAVKITTALHTQLMDGQGAGKRIMPPDGAHALPWLADPLPPTPEQFQAQIDEETSAAILAGFDYEIQGQSLHFSYNELDQQNFADAANAATLATVGIPGLPQTVVWNGWDVGKDGQGKVISKKLVRLTLTIQEFLGLYLNGALVHKATQMEIGGQRKAALMAGEA